MHTRQCNQLTNNFISFFFQLKEENRFYSSDLVKLDHLKTCSLIAVLPSKID